MSETYPIPLAVVNGRQLRDWNTKAHTVKMLEILLRYPPQKTQGELHALGICLALVRDTPAKQIPRLRRRR